MRLINRELGTTFIFSTHDPKIEAMADHVIRLVDGAVAENRLTESRGAENRGAENRMAERRETAKEAGA